MTNIMTIALTGWGIWFSSYIIYNITLNKRNKHKIVYRKVSRNLKKIKRFEKGFNDSCDIKINK